MQIMGIEALVPKPNKDHKIYPYLLRNLAITEVGQVWCIDITYIPMEKGHAYLLAIMDWKSRAVLSWELSNTMDSGFCVRALRNAMALTGRKPIILPESRLRLFLVRQNDELERLLSSIMKRCGIGACSSVASERLLSLQILLSVRIPVFLTSERSTRGSRQSSDVTSAPKRTADSTYSDYRDQLRADHRRRWETRRKIIRPHTHPSRQMVGDYSKRLFA